MGLRQVERGISSFFAKILECFIIFQIFEESSVRYTLKNHQIYVRYTKKKSRKALFNLAQTHFFMACPKPKTRVSVTRSLTIMSNWRTFFQHQPLPLNMFVWRKTWYQYLERLVQYIYTLRSLWTYRQLPNPQVEANKKPWWSSCGQWLPLKSPWWPNQRADQYYLN